MNIGVADGGVLHPKNNLLNLLQLFRQNPLEQAILVGTQSGNPLWN